MTRNEYLRQIAEEGVRRRYKENADSPEVRERLEREIAVLEKQGFVNYFLIVWDFIAWAKRQGIPVGPGAARRLVPWWLTSWASRYRSAEVQAALRALPESGAGEPARYRRGFLPESPA
jgi:hypothetical protein